MLLPVNPLFVGTGLQFFRVGGFEMKAGYTADLGKSFSNQTASARFAYHFQGAAWSLPAQAPVRSTCQRMLRAPVSCRLPPPDWPLQATPTVADRDTDRSPRCSRRKHPRIAG
jgi:hypothetical protein